ncbi:uncharacterized protein ASCRUDRAFT_73903 [Ascoidea rubescens DSM 1968]|uniref:Uncharacterized protein n=1 Tax=Ascoidea rubescens DSM 1968 TaxID=1344418 RepID=A0A1D2VRJ5_9ASCO|nr:hypothetical protein ASCRUDRAFT_73903 [Ascoidea rubescens DSM 1968]ODV64236.1 hypothetical protein ASCRUDRAFT_73903 [Ascoidea rubescens DSM 1968]
MPAFYIAPVALGVALTIGISLALYENKESIKESISNTVDDFKFTYNLLKKRRNDRLHSDNIMISANGPNTPNYPNSQRSSNDNYNNLNTLDTSNIYHHDNDSPTDTENPFSDASTHSRGLARKLSGNYITGNVSQISTNQNHIADYNHLATSDDNNNNKDDSDDDIYNSQRIALLENNSQSYSTASIFNNNANTAIITKLNKTHTNDSHISHNSSLLSNSTTSWNLINQDNHLIDHDTESETASIINSVSFSDSDVDYNHIQTHNIIARNSKKLI